MSHKIYKVVNLVYHTHQNGVGRQRISASIRHDQFTTIYPVANWITIPIGFSFVFINEDAAASFYCENLQAFVHSELWLCESEDEPRRMLGMAKRWSHVPLFWEACAKRDLGTIESIAMPCPETYYGVKTLRLLSKLN